LSVAARAKAFASAFCTHSVTHVTFTYWRIQMRPIVKTFKTVEAAMAWLEQVSGGLSKEAASIAEAMLAAEEGAAGVTVRGDRYSAYVD
jgi:hypothetical protein